MIWRHPFFRFYHKNSDLTDNSDLESATITVQKNGGINRTSFTFSKKYTRFEVIQAINYDWVVHSYSVLEQDTQNVVVVVVINHYTSDLSGKILVRGYVK